MDFDISKFRPGIRTSLNSGNKIKKETSASKGTDGVTSGVNNSIKSNKSLSSGNNVNSEDNSIFNTTQTNINKNEINRTVSGRGVTGRRGVQTSGRGDFVRQGRVSSFGSFIQDLKNSRNLSHSQFGSYTSRNTGFTPQINNYALLNQVNLSSQTVTSQQAPAGNIKSSGNSINALNDLWSVFSTNSAKSGNTDSLPDEINISTDDPNEAIAQAQEQSNSLNVEITDVKESQVSSKMLIAALKRESGTYSKLNTSLQSQYETAKEQLSTAAQTKDSAETAFSAAKENFTNANNNVTAKETEISNLESQIASATPEQKSAFESKLSQAKSELMQLEQYSQSAEETYNK